MIKLKREIFFEPGYDKRTENYGLGAMEIRFVATGERAAIQFLLITGWMPSSVDTRGLHERSSSWCPNAPLPADIGYHAREPQYDGKTSRENCAYLGGAPCYYDGSGLRAQHFFDILRDKGGEALWIALEEEYEARFIAGVPSSIDSANFGETMNAVAEMLREDAGDVVE